MAREGSARAISRPCSRRSSASRPCAATSDGAPAVVVDPTSGLEWHPKEAHLSVTPSHVDAGGRVTVHGKLFGLRRHGCAPTVRLIAFVPGVSPYAAIPLGRVHVGDSRSFTRHWHAKKFELRFRWAVAALQKCKGKTMQRRDT